MLALVGLLAAVAAHPEPSAWPAPVMALRELCDEADLVVRARVERVVEIPREDRDGGSSHVALLRPEDVILGVPASEPVRVGFSPGMACPIPPGYVEGIEVLAFLRWHEGSRRYWTAGVSYGLLKLGPDEGAVYAARIRAYDAIRTSDSTAVERERATLQWLVELTVDPATRWHGAYDLAHRFGLRGDDGRILWSWDPDESVHPVAEHLTEPQRDALREALLALSWPRTLGDFYLLELQELLRDPAVLPYAKAALRRALETPTQDDCGGVVTLMQVAAGLDGRAAAYGLVEEFCRAGERARTPHETRAWPEDAAVRRQLIEEHVAAFLDALER